MGERPTPDFLKRLKGDIAKGKEKTGASIIDLERTREKGRPKAKMPEGLRRVLERVKIRREDAKTTQELNPENLEDENEPPSF
ncbi:MAG: hypothetical protein UR53_C0004G0029 [Candidatus Magasanikbacteria bacterium GW2011_GWC2_34_16]|uniref:Uncharacterized protein n=2 Tax=Candidatus Magasanikiibacteriota TaxID=1752731 RepID=A0A0G0HMH8_9BACT|nr:MAG: hypothetical protein UR53_C0004G0029 [Candidatus Magasanikbacteria bacterium GW2011_GWC2_34_16]KKQ39755.1 MAG: hypothetical protein US58_C0028G0015 [Candidatus Magasanikbacteria bacterium GW2011_GWA2_37_8]